MKKNSIIVVSVAVCMLLIVGTVWFIFADRPIAPPEIRIPGFQSMEMVSSDQRGADFMVTVQHLGMEYFCGLHIALSANSEWVLPLSDELFTVVVSDEKGLELTSNNQLIGRVPVVFIAPVNNSRTYRVGGPGQSKKPIYVKSGVVNLASFDSNTLIRGVEGLRVKVFSDGIETASGRLPMAVNLEKIATLVVDGLQTRTLTGKGLIQGYWGNQIIREGTNSILPQGRFTGVDMVSFHGFPYAIKNNEIILINTSENKMIRYNGETTHEILLQDTIPQLNKINHIRKNGDVIFLSEDSELFSVSTEGMISKINHDLDTSNIFASGDFLISTGGKILNLETGKVGTFKNDYEFFHDEIGMTFENGTLSGWELSEDDEKNIWTLEANLSEEMKMTSVNDDVVFFTLGNICTMYLDVKQGLSSMTLDEFVLDGPLEWITNREMNFPGGEGIQPGIVVFDSSGEMAWSRPGGNIQRVGFNNVMITSDDEIRVYDLGSGIETCSWKHDPVSSIHPTDGVTVLHTDEYQTIIHIQVQMQNSKFEDWVVVVRRKLRE